MKLRKSRANVRYAGLGLMGAALVLAAAALAACSTNSDPHRWSDAELQTLRGLSLDSLPPLPADPSNAYADDLNAARLGQKLFFDTRYSSNGEVACATCHNPATLFQDGLPLAQGVGTTGRRAPSIIGTAYSPWLFWDGRKDSQWAQALGPMESPVEHGGNRTQYAHLMAAHYRTEYEALFGPMPVLDHMPLSAGPVDDPNARAAWDAMSPEDQQAVNLIYANMGKAIAAYERLILPGPSRFDTYVAAALAGDRAGMQAAFTADEAAGLRLFIGEAQCLECHTGPLFTDNEFHNIGVPAAQGLPADVGRLKGAEQVLSDEFNCLSAYSDASPEACAHLTSLMTDDPALAGAFRTPSLRNVAERAPYMHAGQFSNMAAVMAHYNGAPPAAVGQSELEAVQLSQTEMNQVIAFMKTLSAPLRTAPEWLAPPAP